MAVMEYLMLIAGITALCAKQEPDVYVVGSLPNGLNACCLPPIGIFVTERNRFNERLLRHEYEHWQQYRDLGIIGYYAEYADGLSRYGYDFHPMEIAARLAAGEPFGVVYDYTNSVRNGTALTCYNPIFRGT